MAGSTAASATAAGPAEGRAAVSTVAGGAGSGEAAGATAVSTAAISGSKLGSSGARCYGSRSGWQVPRQVPWRQPNGGRQHKKITNSAQKPIFCALFYSQGPPISSTDAEFYSRRSTFHFTSPAPPVSEHKNPDFVLGKKGIGSGKRRYWHRKAQPLPSCKSPRTLSKCKCFITR